MANNTLPEINAAAITAIDTRVTTLEGGLPVSGLWVPTRSAEANLDSNITFGSAYYLRVGATVHVFFSFTADPTAPATATSFEMTIPVASNLGAAGDLAGVAFCGAIAGMGAQIVGSAANNTAKVQWVSSDVTSQAWSGIYSYTVI